VTRVASAHAEDLDDHTAASCDVRAVRPEVCRHGAERRDDANDHASTSGLGASCRHMESDERVEIGAREAVRAKTGVELLAGGPTAPASKGLIAAVTQGGPWRPHAWTVAPDLEALTPRISSALSDTSSRPQGIQPRQRAAAGRSLSGVRRTAGLADVVDDHGGPEHPGR
jgi:hypothetical protein